MSPKYRFDANQNPCPIRSSDSILLDRVAPLALIPLNLVNPRIWLTSLALFLLVGCAGDTRHRIIISTTDQRMVVLRDNVRLTEYPVSTSKFGVGDSPGSYATPVGKLKIKKKIGGGHPSGAVFKSRRPTGEVLEVDAPGRDPIVTRILWLEGLESRNRNAYPRYIYIHGTPEERNIGKPVSYGCIRMRSRDIIELYDTVKVGAKVLITQKPFPTPKPSPSPIPSQTPQNTIR
jgi:lipoprotein-anchoring transpeptidase ErfK/SrfK